MFTLYDAKSLTTEEFVTSAIQIPFVGNEKDDDLCVYDEKGYNLLYHYVVWKFV